MSKYISIRTTTIVMMIVTKAMAAVVETLLMEKKNILASTLQSILETFIMKIPLTGTKLMVK
jgi:hypothetical protein